MKVIAIIVALIVVGYGAYWQGHRVGKSSCPEFAKVQDTHNRELEAFFDEQFSKPTQREMLCDAILEVIEDRPLQLD